MKRRLVNHDISSFKNTQKQVVVLISDIRGFTSISEKYSDIAVVSMLNRYFDVMNKIIIQEYGGYIDKYMGDSILAVFGIDSDKDILFDAIECAMKMQIAMDEVNKENIRMGVSELYMGIGISAGEAVIACIGSELYSELTVIGDIVNLASRIEAFSLRGQILLDEKSYDRVCEYVGTGEKHKVFVKGKKSSIGFYDLLTCNKNTPLSVPQRDIRKSKRVDVCLAFSYQLLDSKHVLDENYDAHSVDMSYDGLLAQIYNPIALFSEIKIKLFLRTNETSEIYAKVIRLREDENKNIFAHMVFTSIDEISRYQLQLFIDSIIQE